MKYDPIPDEHHLVRQVPWGKLLKVENEDGDEIPVGPLHTAFELRPADDFLSATHQEHFSGGTDEQIAQAVQAIRRTWTCTPKSGFVVGEVAAIKAVCSNKGHQIRVIEDPVQGNDAHVAVKRYPTDHYELYEALAAQVWATLVLNSDIPPES